MHRAGFLIGPNLEADRIRHHRQEAAVNQGLGRSRIALRSRNGTKKKNNAPSANTPMHSASPSTAFMWAGRT